MNDGTYSTKGPVCPYCGHLQRPDNDPSIYYDEDLTEVECGGCEKTYSCSLYVSHSWTSSPKKSTGDKT